jgi:3-hydroxyisobutyrate dehydrogenase-like beta-hydroxyacid dehydrogenase
VTRRIGFVGLGNMGLPMCRRLLAAGLPLAVFNRTPEKAAELVERGVARAETIAALAADSDVLISMIADDAALLDVALGERGVLAGARPGLLYVDMSTVSPAASARVAAACAEARVDYLRAPVTGSTALAAAGTLGILASGPRARYDEALEIFRHLGQAFFYLGAGEEARVMKLVLNVMVGIQVAALGEALTLGEKAGLDWQQMIEVVSQSAVASPLVKYKAGPLARRDFSPAATVGVLTKDFDLALATAREVDAAAPLAALTRQLYQATVGLGWGDRDFSAVLLLLERMSGLGEAAD